VAASFLQAGLAEQEFGVWVLPPPVTIPTLKKRVDWERPKDILENHLLPAFGDRPLATLTAKDGLDYVLMRQATRAGAGTIRRECQVLMRLLNLGVRYDLLA
jgi:hypothetical protein